MEGKPVAGVPRKAQFRVCSGCTGRSPQPWQVPEQRESLWVCSQLGAGANLSTGVLLIPSPGA